MNNLPPGALALTTATRLTKIAFDNGFDLEGERDGDWLAFSSTQAPLRLWLTAVGGTLDARPSHSRFEARSMKSRTIFAASVGLLCNTRCGESTVANSAVGQQARRLVNAPVRTRRS